MSQAGYKVLVVDDSPIIRAVVKRNLTLSGVPVESVLEAANGQLALELLRREQVGIIFCDVHMPVMDGVALVRAVRGGEAGQNPRIIIVSSERNEALIGELQGLGVQGVISKPFRPEQFRNLMRRTVPPPPPGDKP